MKNKSTAGRESKPHIGIFGRCNAGKSTLLNFLIGEQAAIVSPEKGTTTDPVRKHFEIQDFAPVVFIDTAGFDDESEVGNLRRGKTSGIFDTVDLAILIFENWEVPEVDFLAKLKKDEIPYVLVRNFRGSCEPLGYPDNVISVDLSTAGNDIRSCLLDSIKTRLPENSYSPASMFAGQLQPNDMVMLVCPIDSEAPSGRLILPQVKAIRELLDSRCLAIVVQPGQIEAVLAKGIKPRVVVTDSQVWSEVKKIVPEEIELTTFSILLAAAKGDIAVYKEGLKKIDELKDGDRILISESCSHQVSCDDIGRVKIPAWMKKYTGKELLFDFVSGSEPLPDDLGKYALIIQCGGCMVTSRTIRSRIRRAVSGNVPITNYGMAICKITG